MSSEDLACLEEMVEITDDAKEELNRIMNEVRTQAVKLQKEVQDRSLEVDSLIFATFQLPNCEYLQVNYKQSVEEKKKVVPLLFKRFHKQIESAKHSDARLRAIADLFQMLEWLHPFPDGQGRTDLILLNKLLCDFGFTPAILENPYYSSHSTLDEWVCYLKEGMNKWKRELKGDSK